MNLDLAGKKAIVTGGSSGIGYSCAAALRVEGVGVLLAALPDGLEVAAGRLRELPSPAPAAEVAAVPCDLRLPDDIERVVHTALERLGAIDILINCAGAAQAGSFLNLPDGAFLDAWTLKLLGYIRMVRAVAPLMIKRRDGRIVNIVGASGRSPSPTLLPVGTTNAALLNFTRGIARELAPYNVRINAISPGPTATPRAEQLAQQTAEARGIPLAEARAEMAQSLPLGRMVEPNEVAAMAVMLVSDRCASITGTEILIDAGSTSAL
ncbi:MAG TPA: SDR family oxidoreductase [Anaerolineales bacterium]|nr:SDR family oxidoreductase [Anaerolineales bacterium]